MTPAEELAATRPRERRGRNCLPVRNKAWLCRVREVREAAPLSLRVVAEALGMSFVNLHQIENGHDPQLTTARKIAAFFGKTVEELWTPLPEQPRSTRREQRLPAMSADPHREG